MDLSNLNWYFYIFCDRMRYFIDDKKSKKETGHIKIKWQKPKNTIVYSVRLPSEC